jgi:hypothetical protein
MTNDTDDTDAVKRAEELHDLAEGSPTEAAGHVDELFALADAADADARERATKALELIAIDVPERLAAEVERLARAVTNGRHVFERRSLSTALALVAQAYPDRVAEHRTAIGELLASEDPNRALGGAGAMMGLAPDHPDLVADSVDRLADLAASRDADVRYYAVSALANLSDDRSDAVRPHADRLREGLDSEPRTMEMAFLALSRVGREHHEAVEGLEDVVLAALDDEDGTVRLAALRLLPAVADNVDSEARNPLLSVRDELLARLNADDDAERRAAAVALTDIARAHPGHLPPAGDARLADAFERAVAETGLDLPDLQVLLERIEAGATA